MKHFSAIIASVCIFWASAYSASYAQGVKSNNPDNTKDDGKGSEKEVSGSNLNDDAKEKEMNDKLNEGFDESYKGPKLDEAERKAVTTKIAQLVKDFLSQATETVAGKTFVVPVIKAMTFYKNSISLVAAGLGAVEKAHTKRHEFGHRVADKEAGAIGAKKAGDKASPGEAGAQAYLAEVNAARKYRELVGECSGGGERKLLSDKREDWEKAGKDAAKKGNE